MADTNTPIKHVVTESQYIDQLPVADGQVIVLSDKSGMYYDMDDTRYEVGVRYWELYSE